MTTLTRGRRQALAFSFSALLHAGLLALPAVTPPPARPAELPLAVHLSLRAEAPEVAPEADDQVTPGDDLSAQAAVAPAPAAAERPAPSPPRAPRQPAPMPPPLPPAPPLPAGPEPVAAPPDLVAAPPEPAAPADAPPNPTEPAAEADEGLAVGNAPETAESVPGVAAERGGTAGEGRADRGGRKRGSKQEADVLPELVYAPKPPYPARSRDLGEEGTVIIAILVGEDGKVRDSRVATSSGHPLLDGSALATVRQKWRFRPGRSAGEPVERWVRVPVEFRIRKR